MKLAINLAEHRLLNDHLIRIGIRKLLSERLTHLQQAPKTTKDWIDELVNRPLAEHTGAANEQHYDIPAAYFRTVLGPHLKYSSGYWPEGCSDLRQSESAMLSLSSKRAELADGQQILELGCGWGSLSLWMAEQYPKSSITSVSNSHSQREYIETQARARGFQNLKIITCDINQFKPGRLFDRVVSVEMFEHIRNHRYLFNRIYSWLEPEGKVFVHIFAHRELCYLFEGTQAKDWMSRYFFTGGIMPSADLLPQAADCLQEDARWEVNGRHYSKTLEAWLKQQDAHEPKIIRIFETCYGDRARLWLQRWRMFYMACSELFAYRDGNEWLVMHYRFSKSA